MTSGRSWLLLTVCGLATLGYSQEKPTPTITPKTNWTLNDVLTFNDAKACQAKLAEYDKWYAKNKPLNESLARENEDLEAKLASRERDLSFGAAVGFGGVVALCIVVAVFRKRFIPKTTRGKQLWVLFPAAGWISFCCLGIAHDPDLMRHPINAAFTALFWASPAFLFGGILFWWFSTQRSTKQLSHTEGEP